MNVDQIYSYLFQINLNLCIGPNSNYNTFYGCKNKCFYFVLDNPVSSIGEKRPPPPHTHTRKLNGLAAPNKKKTNLQTIPPYQFYQVQQQNFKDGLIL